MAWKKLSELFNALGMNFFNSVIDTFALFYSSGFKK